MIDKKLQGKKNRAKGKKFEEKVMEDLESKGWIVARWTKSVELPKLEEKQAIHLGNNNWITRLEPSKGKLINPKPKYNPFTKKIQYTGTGFPDFIAFRKYDEEENFYDTGAIPKKPIKMYEVIGIECKSDGYLDKEEKEKAKWLLKNDIFSKILIVRKGKKRGTIECIDFQTKYKKEVIK